MDDNPAAWFRNGKVKSMTRGRVRIAGVLVGVGAMLVGLGGLADTANAAPEWSPPASGSSVALYAAEDLYEASCQLIRIGDGKGPAEALGYIYGYGTTREAALADVNSRVPQGHYKRHCKVTKQGKRIGVGGRF